MNESWCRLALPGQPTIMTVSASEASPGPRSTSRSGPCYVASVMSESEWFALNRASWNARTPVHLRSRSYDLEAFKAGQSSLKPIELEQVGDVRGKSLLHLQCHFGQDTLSWSRLGAPVTGLDLSDVAITFARQLAAELALPATFVRANLYDLPEVLEGTFDIVYVNMGALNWLPDLDPWGRIVAHYLKPGGIFYMREI